MIELMDGINGTNPVIVRRGQVVEELFEITHIVPQRMRGGIFPFQIIGEFVDEILHFNYGDLGLAQSSFLSSSLTQTPQFLLRLVEFE